MNSDTEMGDDTDTTVYAKRRFGNLWPGPSRAGSLPGGVRRQSATTTTSSPPVSTESNGTNTSRRSSLANLVHGLDVSEPNGENNVEHLDEGDEDDEEDDDDTSVEGEIEGEVEGDGEGAEDDEEEDDEEGEDDEEDDDDESSESETEEDPERGRSTASKPSSFAGQPAPPSDVPPSISINGRSSTPGVIPVQGNVIDVKALLEITDPYAPLPTQSQIDAALHGPSILQNALAQAINAAGLANDGSPSASAATVKPKSKATKPRKHRTPSPSPPPPVPPPPVRTIRLDIKLGGPSNYEVDISRMAKDTGQKEASPPPPPSAMETEEEQKAKLMEQQEELEGAPKKKKRRKKGPAQEYYDTSDPFIDDSELAVDQRVYFAQTKQQGFYVSSGEVALMKDKNPKKPRSKKPAALAATGSLGGGDGTRDSPIALVDEDASEHGFVDVISKGIKGVGLVSSSGVIGGHILKEGAGKLDAIDEEGDEKTGQKRKRYITVVEGGKKRKVVNIHSFHPDLQAAIEKLKEAIAKENWEQKGKFPQGLKPQLAQLALLAIKLDEYDDHFFNLMPVLFPYNKFTMTKLIKRTVFQDHIALLQERQDLLIKQLEEQAKAGFSKAEEEWQKSVSHWHKRQEKLAAGGGDAATSISAAGGPTEPASAGPTRAPSEDKDAMMDLATEPLSTQGGPGAGGEGGKGHGAHPPGKKYRLTEQMKALIWDLVLLSNEACRLENEKNGYEGSVVQISEQGGRKVLYQRIVAAFPEGWMSSGQISRDVSAMKKRLEREAMDA